MEWIYLSPHLDDVALSCGGLVWEQIKAGEKVSIWTICAGDPPEGPLSAFAEELHTRWMAGREATAVRRREDLASCAMLAAAAWHLEVPDCIYRRSRVDGRALYASEAALFGEIDPEEQVLVGSLGAELEKRLPRGAELVCPLAIGGHVDHRLTRRASERLGRRLWYYADYPYVLKEAGELEKLRIANEIERLFPISAEGLKAWTRAIAAHQSQISSFWPDLGVMEAAITDYCQSAGGVRLRFKRPRLHASGEIRG
jgi:LmbE family N-acetylglucosaminyl deacetylase